MAGKRVFKKKSLPKRKREKQTEAVLLIKGWQKQVISFYKNLERNIKRLVKITARS